MLMVRGSVWPVLALLPVVSAGPSSSWSREIEESPSVPLGEHGGAWGEREVMQVEVQVQLPIRLPDGTVIMIPGTYEDGGTRFTISSGIIAMIRAWHAVEDERASQERSEPDS